MLEGNIPSATDTLLVEVIKEIKVPPVVPDTVSSTASGLVRSTKTFELENFDVKVNMLAECPVQLVDIEILNIKPLPIEFKTKIVTVEKLKTVVVKPPFYDTTEAGIVYGALGTLVVIWGVGQLAK